MNPEKLRRESARWVADGLLTPEQAGRILSLYPEHSRNYWLAALVVIGSVLCLGGVILLIASNWQEIPAMLKLTGLLILLAGSTIVGIEAQARSAPRVISECGFLGAAGVLVHAAG